MVLGQNAVVNRTKTFRGALCILDHLQNNGAALKRLRERQDNPAVQFQAMEGFLHRTGVTVGELDKLNIIHVTGTKGKGSTCAFAESVLRNNGFRTGFYSSPHLVHVRERIRINGWPISKGLFTKYFWETYEQLEETKSLCHKQTRQIMNLVVLNTLSPSITWTLMNPQDSHGGTMPFYFQFLTLLAFRVFLKEQVDLTVIEVGIGGQYDCTNIIRKPWVCGITSLGLDHCSLLGDTTEKIAWQKAGIFKPGVPAFTVRQQPGSLKVLQRRAKEIGCPLSVCPDLEQYEAVVGPVRLGLAGAHQRLNASLALQLSFSWLQHHEAKKTGDSLTSVPAACRLSSQTDSFLLGTATLKGLQETEWLGRSQTLRRGSVTYYLDGAHTTASIQSCVCWFREEMQQRDHTQNPGLRILLFNTTGERDSAALLRLLLPCRFDYSLFCPNIPETPTAHLGISVQQMLVRCRENQLIWQSLNALDATHQRHCNSGSQSLVFPCILSALQWINWRKQTASTPAVSLSSNRIFPDSAELPDRLREAGQISVLVTGSLHLVGGALKHLEPSLSTVDYK